MRKAGSGGVEAVTQFDSRSFGRRREGLQSEVVAALVAAVAERRRRERGERPPQGSGIR